MRRSPNLKADLTFPVIYETLSIQGFQKQPHKRPRDTRETPRFSDESRWRSPDLPHRFSQVCVRLDRP